MNTTAPLAHRRDRVTSAAERRVVDYLLAAGAPAAVLSAREIAAGAGTSDATVVRAARSLGFANLRELREALAEAEDEAQVDLLSRLDATISSVAGTQDPLGLAVDRHLQALQLLVHGVGTEEFESAVAVLAAAERVWWSGVGPSAHLAGYAAFLSRRLGRSGGALTHSGADHADELLAVQPGDAAVVFAYGRVHTHVRVLLGRAAELGVPVVLVTDLATRAGSTAELAPVAVRLRAGRGSPGLFASHGPTIVLIEALAVAVAATDQARADRSLTELNGLRHALAGRRIDVDPG